MTTAYWEIVRERAAEFSLCCRETDGGLVGLQVLAKHAALFTPFHTLHVAQLCLAVLVFEDCPDRLRNSAGVPDLDRLVPADADALTVLATAGRLCDLLGAGLADELRNVEEQVAATARARIAVQQLLDEVPHGDPGRERMLEIFWGLRQDLRAIAAVAALTTAALRAVAAPRGRSSEG